MATAKYYLDNWGTRVTKRDPEEESSQPDNTIDVPEAFCASQNQPENSDCAVIDMPTGQDYVKFDGIPCYSNGNRAWCDIQTFGTCQISIGYDMSEGQPNVTKDELKKLFDDHLGQDQCSGYTEDKAKICSIGPIPICTKSWKFGMKRIGVDLR
jgi:hypothetical protein